VAAEDETDAKHITSGITVSGTCSWSSVTYMCQGQKWHTHSFICTYWTQHTW